LTNIIPDSNGDGRKTTTEVESQ